jgi:hypothetical protein
MSHNKLRHEKNCLNCGHTVEERFCTNCGQENLQIQDSAFHLILHYIQDLFHYDGKVWHTLKNLLVKPGLVPGEYMNGKRMRNLEPVRFYVFASTIFFLILFFVVSTDDWNKSTPPELNYTKRIYNLNQEKKFLKGHSDTLYIDLLTQHLKGIQDSIARLDPDSSGNRVELDLSTPIPSDTIGDGWISKMIEKRAEHRRKEMEEKHSGDAVSAATDFFSEVFHKLPLLLFLSMPFFALFLKVLYIGSARRRYVDHFIFSIYHYSFMFMITSLFLIIFYGVDNLKYGWTYWFSAFSPWVFILYLCIYLWSSMGRFYGDRWYYRLPKYFTLMFLLFATIVVLFLLIFFLTVFF